MSCLFLEPFSKMGLGLLCQWRRQDGLGSLYPPSFPPGHSQAMTMALKGPRLGVGRTKGLERKKEGEE